MILVFDIGNTNIVACFMEKQKVLKTFRLQSDLGKTIDEYGIDLLTIIDHSDIKKSGIDGVMISSVVPQLTSVVSSALEKYLCIKPYVAGVHSPHGLSIKLDNPEEIGTDRLMSAFAAYHMFGRNCITVDFGTATTIEAVTKSGAFMGGTIFPGVKLAVKALHSNTAKLPMVDILRPEKVLGLNTVTAIQSGIFYGYLCMVDGMIDMIRKEVFKSEQDVMILSTGGLGASFSSASRHKMRYEPDLIPYGLYFLYDKIAEKHG